MKDPAKLTHRELAAYYFWNDLQALEQALMVARDNDVDLDLVKKWSRKEGATDKFKVFLQRSGK